MWRLSGVRWQTEVSYLHTGLGSKWLDVISYITLITTKGKLHTFRLFCFYWTVVSYGTRKKQITDVLSMTFNSALKTWAKSMEWCLPLGWLTGKMKRISLRKQWLGDVKRNYLCLLFLSLFPNEDAFKVMVISERRKKDWALSPSLPPKFSVSLSFSLTHSLCHICSRSSWTCSPLAIILLMPTIKGGWSFILQDISFLLLWYVYVNPPVPHVGSVGTGAGRKCDAPNITSVVAEFVHCQTLVVC